MKDITDLTLDINALAQVDSALNSLNENQNLKIAFLHDNEAHFVLSYEVKEGSLLTIYNTKLSPAAVTIIAEDSNGQRTVLGNIARGKHLYYVAPKDDTNLKLFIQRAEPVTGIYIGISSIQYNKPLQAGGNTIMKEMVLNNDDVKFVLSYAVEKGGLISIYNTERSPNPVLVTAIGSTGEVLDIGRIPVKGTLYYVSETDETDLKFSIQRAEPINGLYVGISSVRQP